MANESQEYGEQMAELARIGGPEVIEVVTSYLDASARERDSIQAAQTKYLEEERDSLKQYVVELEDQLIGIQSRLHWVLYGGPVPTDGKEDPSTPGGTHRRGGST